MSDIASTIRRAEPGEAAELDALQSRSAGHWQYPPGYFDWAGDAPRVTPSYVRDNPVFVLTDDDGAVIGFYGFTGEHDDDLLLDKMFVDADRIGAGYGKVLWRHAVQTASELGRTAFIIGSDSNAAPFYEAMSAEWYAGKPTVEPTWTVQMYRYTITS